MKDDWARNTIMFILFIAVLSLCVVFGSMQERKGKDSCAEVGGKYIVVEKGHNPHDSDIWGCVK